MPHVKGASGSIGGTRGTERMQEGFGVQEKRDLKEGLQQVYPGLQ